MLVCMCCCLCVMCAQNMYKKTNKCKTTYVTRNHQSVGRQHRHRGKRKRMQPVQVMPAQFLIRSKAFWIQLTHVRCPLIQWKIWNRVQIIHHFSTVTTQNQWTTRTKRWPPPIRRKHMTTCPTVAVVVVEAAAAAKSCCTTITTPTAIQKLKRNLCPALSRTDPSKSWGIFHFLYLFISIATNLWVFDVTEKWERYHRKYVRRRDQYICIYTV